MGNGAANPKRLVLLFDGTWNDVSDRTNIVRLKDSLAAQGADGWPQVPKYFEGVGVRWHEKIRGGAFGRYLSDKVLSAYAYLVSEYRPGDEVFVFGFSRGAFTAQMLVGFCYWCGLLTSGADQSVENLFRRYRDATVGDQQEGHESSLNRSELLERQRCDMPLSAASRGLIDATRVMPIKFVGVFETVRSAGMEALLPRRWRQEREDKLSRRGTLVCRYTRHLPETVESAYQALAIDEYRAAFAERVWIVAKGKKGDGSDVYLPAHVEQRWFAGAHANVGGGYKGDELHRIPLRWMQEKAVGAGLAFTELAEPPKVAMPEHIRDSYREFGMGIYHWLSSPYTRTIRARQIGRDNDLPHASDRRLHETIDESVLRMILRGGYRRPSQHLKETLESISSRADDGDSRLAKEALGALLRAS